MKGGSVKKQACSKEEVLPFLRLIVIGFNQIKTAFLKNGKAKIYITT